jgi:hypothetical protein
VKFWSKTFKATAYSSTLIYRFMGVLSIDRLAAPTSPVVSPCAYQLSMFPTFLWLPCGLAIRLRVPHRVRMLHSQNNHVI